MLVALKAAEQSFSHFANITVFPKWKGEEESVQRHVDKEQIWEQGISWSLGI